MLVGGNVWVCVRIYNSGHFIKLTLTQHMSQILSRQGTFSGLSFGVGIEVNSYTMIQFGVWDWGHSAKNRANNK